jgi:BirA family biotin operon repressor/biotin-[acetyl-CoA-carboxylase] ligase
VSEVCEELQLDGYAFASLYSEVTSTMDLARQRLSELTAVSKQAGLVVARSQRNGRGRQGRLWVSEDGAFMGTFLFAAPGALASLSGYSLAVGVSVAKCMRAAGASVQLKWPNDVVYVAHAELRKVGGILVEVQELDGVNVILVGLGLNLSSSPEAVPHAVSWQQLSGIPIDLRWVIAQVAEALLTGHQSFIGGGGLRAFHSEWRSLSAFVEGQTVLTLNEGTESFCGTYQGIDDAGALILSTSGQCKAIHSAHIVSVVL